MKALIWKELRENVKWIPLPGLVILLVFLIDKPDVPMPDTTDAYFFCLIAAVFGAALGFVQIFFEGHGDKRSLLLHRPLSRARILPNGRAERSLQRRAPEFQQRLAQWGISVAQRPLALLIPGAAL